MGGLRKPKAVWKQGKNGNWYATYPQHKETEYDRASRYLSNRGYMKGKSLTEKVQALYLYYMENNNDDKDESR